MEQTKHSEKFEELTSGPYKADTLSFYVNREMKTAVVERAEARGMSIAECLREAVADWLIWGDDLPVEREGTDG